MPRLLRYADAATFLGGGESPIIARLDNLLGGLLIGAAPVVPAALSWFDAKAEFIRLGHELVGSVRRRRAGVSRYTRTQRLHAAHTIIVVTAFFEGMAAPDLPYRGDDLELTEEERLRIMDPSSAGGVLLSDVPLPAPHEPSEDFEARLLAFYGERAHRLHGFLAGLAAGAALAADGGAVRRADQILAKASLARYRELLGQLAGEFPEFAWWTAAREHGGTRAEVRKLGTALAGVERMLTQAATGRAPDERRLGLAREYRAALGRPITESGDAPPGIRIPTLEEAYVEPLFRVAPIASGTVASDHGWWRRHPLRDQLEPFLAGHLTSPLATATPLLLLGEPGSGKSILTKVLAARLPAEDFLPVRVALRDVPVTADLQDQIEYAIRHATGERLTWPELGRAAGDALPVVMLDGFDELLQATGVSQSDYLINVARFQEREAVQGRPVAVIVTSRTSVADRARPPKGMTAMRLEPFDEERTAAWLDRWNAANAEHFAANPGLSPLPPAIALVHQDLASQPLLLLMLALYDAPANALQRLTGAIGEGELYERLLHDFCEREVTKHRHGLSERQLRAAIEDELRHLSIVSFGMFNRRSQWITEIDLDADLAALIGERPGPAGERSAHVAGGMRSPLGRAETLLWRFFFIHRSQATRDDDRLRTYEFLHATFAEYLVARLTWRVLLDTAARERASALGLAAAPDDALPRALLSFASLSVRTPIIDFLGEMVARIDDNEREAMADLLLRLFHRVHDGRQDRGYAGYEPVRLGVPARHAAYSANLMVLTARVAGTVLASQLFPQATDEGSPDPVDLWHAEALLWRSQLDGENWSSLVDTIRVVRIWHAERRDLRLSVEDGPSDLPGADPNWVYHFQRPATETPAVAVWSHHDHSVLRRKANFQCGNLDDVVHHALEPLVVAMPDTVNTMIRWGDGTQTSVANLLLDVWLAAARDASRDQRAETYRRAIVAAACLRSDRLTAVRLIMKCLATDGEIPSATVAKVFDDLPLMPVSQAVARDVASCALAHLGRDGEADAVIATVALSFASALERDNGVDPLRSELLARIAEVASGSPRVPPKVLLPPVIRRL